MNQEKLFIKPEAVEDFRTLYEILSHAAANYPDRVAYRQIEGRNEQSEITFSQLKKNIDAVRASLIARGWAGKHIALFGETSVEWITVYLAVVSGVGVCVPVDKELPPETIIKQLDFADTELVVSSEKGLKKLSKALPDVADVNTVCVMRQKKDLPDIPGAEAVITLETLIDEGNQIINEKGDAALPAKIDPDADCVIIYTSGTTGANKGVVLSNRNIMGTLRGCARLLHYPGVSFSVLPVNHSYELHAHLMSCMYCGTTVCINDDLKHLLKNLETFSPEMSCMVPMMLDLIVRRMKKQIAESGREEKFLRAVKISNALRKIGIDRRQRMFAEVLAPLGGKLKMIICGGAALSQDTISFLDSIGITVYNGYGITECSPVAAVNPSSKVVKNSVGHLLPTMKVRIAEPDENGNGEIQLSGDNVMKGYYKAEEDTKKVFTKDGWFRTGDLGHVDKNGFLFLSGRLKNLIILANGKNIYPEEIEEALQQHIPYIKECVVYADKEGTGLNAVFYLDREYRAEHGLETAEQAKDHMLADINSFNSVEPGFKRIQNYSISDTEFEKSSTHKIQRFKIAAINNR